MGMKSSCPRRASRKWPNGRARMVRKTRATPPEGKTAESDGATPRFNPASMFGAPRASGSGSSWPSRARPSTLAVLIFLPLPGPIGHKPEPGELPAELPMGHVSTRARFREPPSSAANHAIRLRQASEPPLSYNPAASHAEFFYYSRPVTWATRGTTVRTHRPGSVLCGAASSAHGAKHGLSVRIPGTRVLLFLFTQRMRRPYILAHIVTLSMALSMSRDSLTCTLLHHLRRLLRYLLGREDADMPNMSTIITMAMLVNALTPTPPTVTHHRRHRRHHLS